MYHFPRACGGGHDGKIMTKTTTAIVRSVSLSIFVTFLLLPLLHAFPFNKKFNYGVGVTANRQRRLRSQIFNAFRHEDDHAQKVRNPKTNQFITVGGTLYKKLLEEGYYVHHDGELHPINVEILRNWDSMRLQREGEQGEEPLLAHHTVEPAASHPVDTGGSIPTLEPWTVLHESNNVVFLHKPPGLLSVAGIGPEKSDCLANRFISSNVEKNKMAKPCHRLDRDTSGIQVYGLNKESHRLISKQFEVRTAKKVYVALVAGLIRDDEGIVDLPIGKTASSESGGFRRWCVGGDDAREAKTEWKVIRRYIVPTPDDTTSVVPGRVEPNNSREPQARYTKVELRPLTGRGQQLRLHMKAIGHPILGDSIHANEGRIAEAAPRLCLHAQELTVSVLTKGGEQRQVTVTRLSTF